MQISRRVVGDRSKKLFRLLDAFRADQAQVAWARRVLGTVREGGVASVDGRMIDAPLIRQAQHILDSLR